MELISNAQYLKTMINDGISPGFLNLSDILNVGKYVSYIVSNIYALVDKTDMVSPQLVVAATASLWHVILGSCYLVLMSILN